MNIRTDFGFLRIDNPYFFGQCSHSPSGRFVLGWSDAVVTQRVGLRERFGKYLLLEGEKIAAAGKLERPNDGKVSNAGSFIFNDWMFGYDLRSTFYGFSCDGEVLVKQTFNAVLYNNGLSDDGRFAICQTCLNEGERVGCILTIFDLDQGVSRSQFSPIVPDVPRYGFDTANKIIHLLYNDGRNHRYTFDGVFLDREKWEEERLINASGYQLVEIAAEQLRSINSPEADSLAEPVALLRRSLSLGVSEHYQARVHRMLGQVYLKCGKKSEAIDHLEAALRLNPNVGVKRLLSALKS